MIRAATITTPTVRGTATHFVITHMGDPKRCRKEARTEACLLERNKSIEAEPINATTQKIADNLGSKSPDLQLAAAPMARNAERGKVKPPTTKGSLEPRWTTVLPPRQR